MWRKIFSATLFLKYIFVDLMSSSDLVPSDTFSFSLGKFFRCSLLIFQCNSGDLPTLAEQTEVTKSVEEEDHDVTR